MITEVRYSSSKDRVIKIIVNNTIETVYVNTYLNNKSIDVHIEELKKRFEDESNDLILLVVKYELPNGCPNYMKSTVEISTNNALRLLKEAKDYLQNNDLNGTHLSNLPQHFWETLGEGINEVQKINDGFSTEIWWNNFVDCNKNVWGFKIVKK
jgi:hypothetical protein